MAILASNPGTDWSGKALAQELQAKPHNLLTQLAEWTRLGFIRRTGAGTYALHDADPAKTVAHDLTPDETTHHTRSWT